jgi:predicted RNA-binding protein associated with RNAse of E/G family
MTTLQSLVLVRPDSRHSLWLQWERDWRFRHWYVNLDRRLGRGERTVDYVDDKLDLVVAPDGSVRWKDEDELEQAARLGLLDAAAVRAEAERVVADPPWPTGWEDWRPDPEWPPPRLPDGWDVV